MLRILAKFIFAVVLIAISTGLIVEMRYNVSLSEYLAYSAPLTREEQQYLKEQEMLVYGAEREDAPSCSVSLRCVTST